MTVIAPYTASYLNRIPYLTVAEFQNGATGLDISNLIPPQNLGGAQGSNVAALAVMAELIEDASAIIDGFCFGAFGTLCATTEIDIGRIRMARNGWFKVHTKFWPVLAVSSFSVGPTPAQLQSIPLSTANCWPEEQGFVVTSSYNALPSVTNYGPLQFGGPGLPGYEQFAQWTYTNGWPNTLLSADATAGASSINLINIDGIYPGTPLNIYDIPSDEAITVAAGWNGSNPVPLTSALQYAHSTGVSVTALPRTVKRACIKIAGSLIKARGSGGLQLTQSGGIEQVKDDLADGKGELEKAHGWLRPFRVVY